MSARTAHFTTIYNQPKSDTPDFTPAKTPTSRHAIDQALLLKFIGPNSYTGENMLEFQIHGGTAVKSSLLEALSNFPRLREAEPGEFTRRALLNGKLDLVQAEAVHDLITAEGSVQNQLAVA
jgi:tRNA modification GTPase